MELIEREGFLLTLRSSFERVTGGEGHCIFLSGEAGMGKTSLIRRFIRELDENHRVLQGTCDALFTPRPLAPLYDIAWQTNSQLFQDEADMADRSALFARYYQELGSLKGPTIIIFEDIHWADEATFDFIKFLSRRIVHIHCLFVLTYRNDEIHARHPLRNVLGQLPPDSFTRLQLPPLSRTAVEEMAKIKGWQGENVFTISGGNPFYVSEILASYSPGIPENIKDSILSVYNRQEESTKQIWNILSVLPFGLEMNYLSEIQDSFPAAIGKSLNSGILLLEKDCLFFKHELYRRTIETSLSPLLRVDLNRQILQLFLDKFSSRNQIERIVHLAKNANDYDLVTRFAPIAAKQAAGVGAHVEAAKLYYTAIEYYQGADAGTLIPFYESYAYECYLTNRIREAIIFTGKALQLWKNRQDQEHIGNCLWFLSRLWWFDGDRKQSETYAKQSIEVLEPLPSSRAKAMAFSNMAHMTMLSDHTPECLLWGEKAISIARELNLADILAQGLNSMGSSLMLMPGARDKGIRLLHESLEIALKYSYHEPVARAYAALGTNHGTMREYQAAEQMLDAGIEYCEKRDLDSMKLYMESWKARIYLETGRWEKAHDLSAELMKNEDLVPIIKIGTLITSGTLMMRIGDGNALPLLQEARNIAFVSMELQRILPALAALLEYEWINGTTCIEEEDLNRTIVMLSEVNRISKKSRLYFWLKKARPDYLMSVNKKDIFGTADDLTSRQEAAVWKKTGCHYEEALALSEGSEEDKKKALVIIQGLGATVVYEKLKMDMRVAGIKSIPRGRRKSTLQNVASLTERELDVLSMLKEGMQNKEIAGRLFISAKTVDHHISSILFKLDVPSRVKAVPKAMLLGIIK